MRLDEKTLKGQVTIQNMLMAPILFIFLYVAISIITPVVAQAINDSIGSTNPNIGIQNMVLNFVTVLMWIIGIVGIVMMFIPRVGQPPQQGQQY